MDLSEILSKTKDASDKVERKREPVFIATKDRPYEIITKNSEEEQKENEKTDNKPTTNHKQTDNKPTTNHKQTDNKKEENFTILKETVNKVVTKPITEVVTNRKQTDNKPITTRSFSALVGLQRSITFLVYEECKKTRSKVTNPLTLEYIGAQVGADKNSVKTTVYRLVVKEYLSRSEFKNGRGGWTRYELAEEVFHELLQNESSNKVVTNHKQTVNKVVTKPITQPITTVSSSSSYNINTTTTSLPDDWLDIDLSEASNFGFTKTHLLQFYNIGGYTPQIVEDSLHFFLFDLKNNNKEKDIKTNPLAYFMGIMRRGGGYAAPDNYESKKDRAMRIYLEKQIAIQEKRESLENKFFDMEFQKWSSELTEEDKNKILPLEIINMNISSPKIAALRTYFKSELWKNVKAKIENEEFS